MTLTPEIVQQHHLHIGSLKKETNPKTRKYQSGVSNGLQLIDPQSIVSQLNCAKEKFQAAKKANKDILVICEKALYGDEVVELAKKHKFHYLTYKVPGGFLTNFETLSKTIQSMNEKKKFIQSEEYARLTKKERVMISRQLTKIEKVYEGVKLLKKKPDLVIVVDGDLMTSIIDEIEITGIDTTILASTNFDRWIDEDQLVVMNMQSYASLDFALSYIIQP